MLDWLAPGALAERVQPNDMASTMEPPETPAPLFAVRAIKSALFGSPNAEDDDDAKAESTPAIQTITPMKSTTSRNHEASRSESLFHDQRPIPMLRREETVPMLAPSPAKSILLTPGAALARRKTVSFGEGVIDNEKKAQLDLDNMPTPRVPGRFPSPWSTRKQSPLKQRSAKGTPMKTTPDKTTPNKFTQSLLDARTEKTLSPAPSPSEAPTPARPRTTPRRQKSEPIMQARMAQPTGDETLNLDEPQSKSGQYWKTEFDNYQTRSSREIKNLIKYRQVAKSFARKKDAEASRLADQLKKEEAKVVDMEGKITKMAAAMAGDGQTSAADKDQAVRDLVQQTATTLQYKHEVDHLRKTLDRHGVLPSGADVKDQVQRLELNNALSRAKKAEQELHQANKKLAEMDDRRSDIKRLQDLVRDAESKTSTMEKENAALKASLMRVKSEMSRYEERRKTKEDNMKHRINKLERRNQDFKDRIRRFAEEKTETSLAAYTDAMQNRSSRSLDRRSESEATKVPPTPASDVAEKPDRRSFSHGRSREGKDLSTQTLRASSKPTPGQSRRHTEESSDIWAKAGESRASTRPRRPARPSDTNELPAHHATPTRPTPRRPVSSSHIPIQTASRAQQDGDTFASRMRDFNDNFSRTLNIDGSNSRSRKRISAPGTLETSFLSLGLPDLPAQQSPAIPTSPSMGGLALPSLSPDRDASTFYLHGASASATTDLPLTGTSAVSTRHRRHSSSHSTYRPRSTVVPTTSPQPTPNPNSTLPLPPNTSFLPPPPTPTRSLLTSSPRKQSATPLPPDREAAARDRIRAKKSADLKSRRKRITRVGEGKDNLRSGWGSEI